MTDFKAWTNLCTEFNTDIFPIYKATDRPECGLYMTKSKPSRASAKTNLPVFQTWINDNRECVTFDLDEAIAYWKHRAKEEGIEYTDNMETMRRMRR